MPRFKKIIVYLLFFLSTSTYSFASNNTDKIDNVSSAIDIAECKAKKYHIQTKINKHHLTDDELKTLVDLANTNDLESTRAQAKGMKLLGERGDTYAAIAEKVLSEDSLWPYSVLRKFIRKHWLNTVGEEEMKKKFNLVARQHFKQYVEMVQLGSFPDSDQILNSYLNAARVNDLPDIVVFDAAWAASDHGKMITWEQLNNLPPSRTVSPSKSCYIIDKVEANKVVINDYNLINDFNFNPSFDSWLNHWEFNTVLKRWEYK